nr:MAG TPA: hypothetical protein [Caudoviricetes sp.]
MCFLLAYIFFVQLAKFVVPPLRCPFSMSAPPN